MSTRLQVVMDEEEARRLRRRAKAEGLTLSEWVRRVLRRASEEGGGPTKEARIAAFERALACGHPTDDAEAMIAAIERGRDLR